MSLPIYASLHKIGISVPILTVIKWFTAKCVDYRVARFSVGCEVSQNSETRNLCFKEHTSNMFSNLPFIQFPVRVAKTHLGNRKIPIWIFGHEAGYLNWGISWFSSLCQANAAMLSWTTSWMFPTMWPSFTIIFSFDAMYIKWIKCIQFLAN